MSTKQVHIILNFAVMYLTIYSKSRYQIFYLQYFHCEIEFATDKIDLNFHKDY